MKLYVAGPMTGIPAFNFPAFDAAAEHLRALGHDVVSPAELDDPSVREAAMKSPDGSPGSGSPNGETWADFLARDVKLIGDDVEAVATLPGWEDSRGAALETFVARLTGKPVYRYEYRHAIRLPRLCPMNDADVFGPILARWGLDLATEAATATGEVRVTNAATGGQKGRKPERMELLPFDVLRLDVAPLYAAGAEKYDDHNWRKGYDWSLSFGAMQRHAAQWWHGEDNDPETRCSHLASVVFHALALLYFARHFPELDDRPPLPPTIRLGVDLAGRRDATCAVLLRNCAPEAA